jgi:hypothetical protein
LQSSEQKRSKVTDQYGCINANPKKPPEGETLETLEEKRLTMIDLFHARQGDHKQIKHLMTVTYYSQRAVIRDGNRLADIIEQFPFLLSETGLYCHFENLVGIPMFTLRESLAKQSGHIISYMSGKQSVVRVPGYPF